MSLKAERVASVIKKSISEMLVTELSDPKIGFATITDVDVTNDLSFAKVYVTFLGKKERNDAGLQALQRAKGRIRTFVSRRLDTRKCPDLIFLHDDSLETGNRIEKILSDLSKEEK